ncbi:secondary thiamine-phosphate synthase enzyme YjbQ [Spirochaeta cellobiosiphila]|uniref:secondary thiamine-phosphate synthase enzyme YjbQ n=1 Tax=Spirochaeta cellobiosiphila TaxID=504483 RepID=UPI00041A688E|nr:secondary thiamine-phosphate synthase enzyme YjbQ [Spirochaeta cellobiosiphila]
MIVKTLTTDHHDQLLDITKTVETYVQNSGIREGLCVVYSPHTTAGITINEAYDGDVKKDIIYLFNNVAPWNDNNYKHSEGNSAAHFKTLLTGTSATIPFVDGGLTLGTWQGIYFCEFDGPRHRQYHISLLGNY